MDEGWGNRIKIVTQGFSSSILPSTFTGGGSTGETLRRWQWVTLREKFKQSLNHLIIVTRGVFNDADFNSGRCSPPQGDLKK